MRPRSLLQEDFGEELQGEVDEGSLLQEGGETKWATFPPGKMAKHEGSHVKGKRCDVEDMDEHPLIERLSGVPDIKENVIPEPCKKACEKMKTACNSFTAGLTNENGEPEKKCWFKSKKIDLKKTRTQSWHSGGPKSKYQTWFKVLSPAADPGEDLGKKLEKKGFGLEEEGTGGCKDGDVRAAVRKASDFREGGEIFPEIFSNKKFHPICGPFFWNNNFGATTFCQKLGFKAGEARKKEKKMFSRNAMPIGTCNPGEKLDSCTGGGNGWVGTGLAYPHRTGCRPVSDQCQVPYLRSPCHTGVSNLS